MNILEPTPEQLTNWNEFVRGRPTRVREAIEKSDLAPWKLYRLKSSGHRVTLYSIDEPEDPALPVTLKVDVLGRFNAIAFERRVFGIALEDLEECDLPGPDETVGTPETNPAVAAALGRIGGDPS